MVDPVSCLMRQAARRPGEPLRVVTGITHERHNSYWAGINARFWLVRGLNGFKESWNTRYARLPPNHTVLPPGPRRDEVTLPDDLVPDLIVAQHRSGQFQLFKPLADRLHVPLLVIEHTLPRPEWTAADLREIRRMRGDVNVFITTESRAAWGWGEAEASVVEHGIDTDLFRPGADPRHTAVMAVANDYKNRGDILGWDVWCEATRDMPTVLLGDTPGHSEAPPSVESLATQLAAGSVFACTARSSPIPMSLLEAMSAGHACVCIRQSAVASVIEHGENGLLADDAKEFRSWLIRVRADRSLREHLGRNARRTVLERFPLGRFASDWERVMRAAAELSHRQ